MFIEILKWTCQYIKKIISDTEEKHMQNPFIINSFLNKWCFIMDNLIKHSL